MSLLAWHRSGIRRADFRSRRSLKAAAVGARLRRRNCHVPAFRSRCERLLLPFGTNALGLRHATPACRGDSPDPRARSAGRAQHDLGIRPRDGSLASAPRLPGDRRAEGGNDRPLRLPPLAPGDHGTVLEGGQLLRPALVARRGLVSRSVPAAQPREAGRRGEPELSLPPARTRAGSSPGPGREARRSPP